MAKRQIHTKTGIIEEEYESDKEKLRKDIDKCITNDEKINKILLYLGV